MEVPSLKVPSVTATFPLEVMSAVLALIVPPVCVSPTHVTVAVSKVTTAVPLTLMAPLRVTVPAPVMVYVPPEALKLVPLMVPVV